jgi:hypothetical protein
METPLALLFALIIPETRARGEWQKSGGILHKF